jgi:hypothetical protein
MGHKVRQPELPESPRLRFSFKYLDLDHPKFNAEACPREFWLELHRRIQEYSTWTVEEFRDQHNNLDHRHTIYFPETSEPNGFGIDEENLDLEEPWQFSTRTAPECIARVHGFLQDDTFYVRWLDPNHLLYRTLGIWTV